MALGFTFTEYDEWRMLIAKGMAMKFMSTFGDTKPTDHFVKVNKMVEVLRIGKNKNHSSEVTKMVKNPLAPKEDMTRSPIWKRIRGIKGYMFAIVDDEMKCINALTEENVKYYKDKNIMRFKFYNQYDCSEKTCSHSVLKLAFCLKYNLSVNDSRLLGKAFKGTVSEPLLKNKVNEAQLWEVLHSHE